MKKVFGIQAELNFTADEEVVHGIGKGIQNGSVVISDIVKELKPIITESIKKQFEKRLQKNIETNND